jgi:3-dehydroquinate synthase
MHIPSPTPLTWVDDIFTHTALIQACPSDIAQIIMITDNQVGPLYAQRLSQHLTHHSRTNHIITIPAGESSKSRPIKAHIEDQMLALGCGRDTLIMALGGGVITDISGFVAATFCRGIPAIYIPTSLMAMVDAAHGGKTGINTPHGKNLLGTFTLPKATFMAISLLNTLPQKAYLDAFAEVVKHALIFDPTYFDFIANHIDAIHTKHPATLMQVIKRSYQIKSTIVAQDQHEQGKRALLNFGHSIAHALEYASDYTISHGQAVAMGMLAESHISLQMGLLAAKDLQQMHQLLSALHIPLHSNTPLCPHAIKQALTLDKKTRQGTPRFVLLKHIGEAAFNQDGFTHAVTDTILNQAIDYALTLEASHAHSDCC